MKILLATDGSKQSDAAIEMVSIFAFQTPGEIRIVSVVDMALPPTLDFYGGNYFPPTTELENVARENAMKVLEMTMQKLMNKFTSENVTITTEVLIGSPESRIVETAEEMHADLIVVGSHGYNRWERLLLGSVSDSVVHHAPCSVLIVRAPKE
jgi:nucleotide-binding universal stress UspA family protein